MREREKAQEGHSNWDMLKYLSFLDPHIIERQKYSMYTSTHNLQDSSNINTSFSSPVPLSFDKQLINVVRKTEQIWNRNSNSYTMNRHVKNDLWQEIGKQMNKDGHYCMLRWKALREKYIRQKNKAQQAGEQKWELLEDLQFLDQVILYRRKPTDSDGSTSSYSFMNSVQHSNFGFNNEQGRKIENSFCSGSDDNSLNDSSSDFIIKVEAEIPDSSHNSAEVAQNKTDYPAPQVRTTSYQKPDSSYVNSNDSSDRKTSQSENSEPEPKRIKYESAEENTPEKLFGNLVVLMLMRKPEAERNLAMVEIMKILSK